MTTRRATRAEASACGAVLARALRDDAVVAAVIPGEHRREERLTQSYTASLLTGAFADGEVDVVESAAGSSGSPRGNVPDTARGSPIVCNSSRGTCERSASDTCGRHCARPRCSPGTDPRRRTGTSPTSRSTPPPAAGHRLGTPAHRPRARGRGARCRVPRGDHAREPTALRTIRLRRRCPARARARRVPRRHAPLSTSLTRRGSRAGVTDRGRATVPRRGKRPAPLVGRERARVSRESPLLHRRSAPVSAHTHPPVSVTRGSP